MMHPWGSPRGCSAGMKRGSCSLGVFCVPWRRGQERLSLWMWQERVGMVAGWDCLLVQLHMAVLGSSAPKESQVVLAVCLWLTSGLLGRLALSAHQADGTGRVSGQQRDCRDSGWQPPPGGRGPGGAEALGPQGLNHAARAGCDHPPGARSGVCLAGGCKSQHNTQHTQHQDHLWHLIIQLCRCLNYECIFAINLLPWNN